MNRKPSKWCTGFTVAVLVGLMLACNGIRQDEFGCENAVMHLVACCPGFTGSNMDCTYVPPGNCGTTTVYPVLSVDQSACIEAESCDALRSSGVCARAAGLTRADSPESQGPGYQEPEVPYTDSTPAPEVCP